MQKRKNKNKRMSSQDIGGAAQHEAPEGKDAAKATLRQCGFPSCAAAAAAVTKKCTACGAMWYCSRDHQRGHWKAHKVECRGGKAVGASVGGSAAGGAGVAAAEEKDAGEGGGGGDAGERTATEARYDMLGAKMKEDGSTARRRLAGRTVVVLFGLPSVSRVIRTTRRP